MADKIAHAQKYRLTGVKAGSAVSECLDKYGRWEYGYRRGVIVRNSTTSVSVDWEDEEGFVHYTAGDARYEVDRGRWLITPPAQQNIFDLMGKGYDKGKLDPPKIAASPALTGDSPHGKIDSSPPSGGHTFNRGDAMPRKTAAQKRAEQEALAEKFNTNPVADEVDDELDDDELDDEVNDTAGEDDPEASIDDDELEDDEDDELDEPVAPEPKKRAPRKSKAKAPAKEADDEEDDLPERETYTAKQVATRIGTDSKTLRKFFRSPASTVEPVGQGGRYEFPAEDLGKIRDEFTKWNTTKPTRAPAGTKKAAAPKGRQAPAGAELIEEDDEILELDDEDEPTADELDDIELDDEAEDDDELDD